MYTSMESMDTFCISLAYSSAFSAEEVDLPKGRPKQLPSPRVDPTRLSVVNIDGRRTRVNATCRPT